MSDTANSSSASNGNNVRKTVIVGSGPAGLSAAYFLGLKRYAVTIFESASLFVIHLKRRNILRALVSSRIAYNTGIYGVRSEKDETEYRNKIQSIVSYTLIHRFHYLRTLFCSLF